MIVFNICELYDMLNFCIILFKLLCIIIKGFIKEDIFYWDVILFVFLYNCICSVICVNFFKDFVYFLKIEGLFKCFEIVKMIL